METLISQSTHSGRQVGVLAINTSRGCFGTKAPLSFTLLTNQIGSLKTSRALAFPIFAGLQKERSVIPNLPGPFGCPKVAFELHGKYRVLLHLV